MTIAISTLAITAIVTGLLILCLGIVIFAGAVNEAVRRKMVEQKKAEARTHRR